MQHASSGRGMRCLIVHAHPLPASLTRHFFDTATNALTAQGHAVETLDLYPAGFDPRLQPEERASHYTGAFDTSRITAEVNQLTQAEILVLVFPTWWFGLPAMLKGWVDRIFAPGVAFAHTPDFGPIKPLLTGLKHVVVVTTLGSPWWVDRLVMRRPVRHALKSALFRACAPQARFHMHSFYSAEAPKAERVERMVRAIGETLGGLR